MSAALTPTESDGSPVSDRAPEKASELRLDAFIRCIEYDPSWNDDNVDSGRRFVMTKHLSDETLCPVSDHGRPQFPRDADSDPSNVALSPIREDRQIPKLFVGLNIPGLNVRATPIIIRSDISKALINYRLDLCWRDTLGERQTWQQQRHRDKNESES